MATKNEPTPDEIDRSQTQIAELFGLEAELDNPNPLFYCARCWTKKPASQLERDPHDPGVLRCRGKRRCRKVAPPQVCAQCEARFHHRPIYREIRTGPANIETCFLAFCSAHCEAHHREGGLP